MSKPKTNLMRRALVAVLIGTLPVLTGCRPAREAPLATPEASGSVPSAPEPAPAPQPLHTLQIDSDELLGTIPLAFSPEGKTLATEDYHGRIMLWDPASGRLKRTLQRHSGGVDAIAFTANGRTLVTGSQDGTVRLWNLETGQLKQTLRGSWVNVNALAVSPDGKFLAFGGGDNKVWIWKTASWKLRRVLKGHEDPEALAWSPVDLFVSRMAFSPNGKLLAVAHAVNVRGEPQRGADYITVWDTATWRMRRRLSMGQSVHRVMSVAFAPDSKRLAIGFTMPSAGAEGEVWVWDTTTGESRILVPQVEQGALVVRVISGDRPTVIVGGGRKVSFFDLATGSEVDRRKMGGPE